MSRAFHLSLSRISLPCLSACWPLSAYTAQTQISTPTTPHHLHPFKCHRVENWPHAVDELEVAAYGVREYVTSRHMPPGRRRLSRCMRRVLTTTKPQSGGWRRANRNPADNPGLPAFPEEANRRQTWCCPCEAYNHSGDMTDQYQVFVLPADPDIDLSIRALEVGQTAMWLTMPFGLGHFWNRGQPRCARSTRDTRALEGLASPRKAISLVRGPGALTLAYPPGIGRTVPLGSRHFAPDALRAIPNRGNRPH